MSDYSKRMPNVATRVRKPANDFENSQRSFSNKKAKRRKTSKLARKQRVFNKKK